LAATAKFALIYPTPTYCSDLSRLQIALRLARLLAQNAFNVTSVIRDPAQASDITAVSANPYVLSLEDAPISAFTELFAKTRAQLVYFAAGAGGKGGAERTRTVDYEGAIKVFDAVEGVEGDKPRVILVSAIDSRNPDKLETFPAHYNEEDKERSLKAHVALRMYYKWKYEADKNLVARTAFRWTILRPGTLTDEPGTGLVEIGRTHLKQGIPVRIRSPPSPFPVLLTFPCRETTSQRYYSTLPPGPTRMASRSMLLAAKHP
jgi:NAD(P)H-binding